MIVASLLLILVAVALLVLGLVEWLERVAGRFDRGEPAGRGRPRGRRPPGGRRARRRTGDADDDDRGESRAGDDGCRRGPAPAVDAPGRVEPRPSPGGHWRGGESPGAVAEPRPGDRCRRQGADRSTGRRRASRRRPVDDDGGEPDDDDERPAGRAGGAARSRRPTRPGSRGWPTEVLVIDGRPALPPAGLRAPARPGRASRCRSARRSSSASRRAACASPTARCSPTPAGSDRTSRSGTAPIPSTRRSTRMPCMAQ